MKGPRALADTVTPVLGPALAAQGFTGFELLGAWPEIVGERLAAASQPLHVDWPKRRHGDESRRPEPGVLVVRAESAFAIELQHLAPVLLERINAVYGWRCIGRIVLKQGRVIRHRPPARRREPVSAAQEGRIVAATAPIADPALEEALRRLGRGVAGADPGLPPSPGPLSGAGTSPRSRPS